MEHLGTDNVDVGIPLCDIIVEAPFKTAIRDRNILEFSSIVTRYQYYIVHK